MVTPDGTTTELYIKHKWQSYNYRSLKRVDDQSSDYNNKFYKSTILSAPWASSIVPFYNGQVEVSKIQISLEAVICQDQRILRDSPYL